jgi:hypothetical protein
MIHAIKNTEELSNKLHNDIGKYLATENKTLAINIILVYYGDKLAYINERKIKQETIEFLSTYGLISIPTPIGNVICKSEWESLIVYLISKHGPNWIFMI